MANFPSYASHNNDLQKKIDKQVCEKMEFLMCRVHSSSSNGVGQY